MSLLEMIISGNFATLILVAGILVMLSSNRLFERQTNTNFILLCLVIIILDFADILDFYFSSQVGFSSLRFVTSAIGYILRPLAIVMITRILLRNHRFSTILWVPLLIEMVLVSTSFFTHLVFWFSDDGYFMRGILGYTPHLVSAFFLIVLSVFTIKGSKSIAHSELVTVVFIIIIGIVATLLESFGSFKFLISGAMAVSCGIYYVFFTLRTYRYDVLTAAFNRKSFFDDASLLLSQNFVLVSADLDGLKVINDAKGHSAGDLALKALASSMKNAGGKKFRIYRTGGDEFMAIGKNCSAEEASMLVENAVIELRQSALMASFGIASFKPGDSFDAACNVADMHMYENKSAHKAAF